MKPQGTNRQSKPKKGSNKPDSKPSGKKLPPKKKSRKAKKIFKNKIAVISITGAVIAIALVFSALFVYFHNIQEPSAAPEIAVEPEAPVEITHAPENNTVLPETTAPAAPPQSTVNQPTTTVSQRPADQRPATQSPATQNPLPAVNQPEQSGTAAQPQPELPSQQQQTAIQNPAAQRPPEIVSRGRLVFVIDDAGNNLRELEPFLRFPGPLTIAVLPGLPNSAEAARRIRAAGKEVFLHQPMESLGGSNPGPGAIYSGMDEAEIRSIVNKNLDELWPVKGMNNHEGSKITMDEKIMEIILQICRERGILFLDSRTTAETKAPLVSKNLGMSIRERDVFLDNEQDRDSIMRYLNTGLDRAGQKGNAVMIGHTWSPNLAPLLEELYPGWIAAGFSLSTVTGLENAK